MQNHLLRIYLKRGKEVPFTQIVTVTLSCHSQKWIVLWSPRHILTYILLFFFSYHSREVLFSGHQESEEFLHQVMCLLVASHYRNSPDDLQVLCDAPAHHLFVLLPPIFTGMKALPTVLSVIQVWDHYFNCFVSFSVLFSNSKE